MREVERPFIHRLYFICKRKFYARKKYATLEISPYGAAHAHYWHHSRPQSCDPCGQRNGSVAVARPKDLGRRMVLRETGLVLCRKNDVRLERN